MHKVFKNKAQRCSTPLKRALQETNGLDIGSKFASSLWFCYRVVVETSGRTSVPNSKLSTPPGGLYIRRKSQIFGKFAFQSFKIGESSVLESQFFKAPNLVAVRSLSLSFGPHTHTKMKVEYPPGPRQAYWI